MYYGHQAPDRMLTHDLEWILSIPDDLPSFTDLSQHLTGLSISYLLILIYLPYNLS